MRTRVAQADSVKQKLLNRARERGEDFNLVLTRYAMERLLYRITRTPETSSLILKGAALFLIWTDLPHRPTRDLDLLGTGNPDMARLEKMFRAVCATAVEEDGLSLDPASVRGSRIREEEEYEGVRIEMMAHLGTARLPVQVDIGFGDSVVPGPEEVDYPVLLGHPAPRLRAYRRETVIAEKFQAMVEIGMANSRMKDFFDIQYLAAQFSYTSTDLSSAILSTFHRRATPLPTAATPPVALTKAFSEDAAKVAQWKAFLRRSKLETASASLAEIVEQIREFLMPLLKMIQDEDHNEKTWPRSGPWR